MKKGKWYSIEPIKGFMSIYDKNDIYDIVDNHFGGNALIKVHRAFIIIYLKDSDPLTRLYDLLKKLELRKSYKLTKMLDCGKDRTIGYFGLPY